MSKDGATVEQLLDAVKILIVTYGLTNEFRYYILICGLFTPERNIVKFWPQYEKAFLQLIAQDGKIGIRHLLQSIVQYFIKKYPEMIKFAGTFMKLMYD